MFVQASDFELPEYSIPNLDDENADDGTFDSFCDEQEEAELRLLLGPVLYDQLILGLAVVPTPDVKWTRLRDGFEYVYQEKTRKWLGLNWLLKPYIYYVWMRNEEIKKTQAGGSLALAENAERVSLASELCRKYNEYVDRSGFGECKNYVTTLYGFLSANKEVDYVDWENCSDIEYINPWNI